MERSEAINELRYMLPKEITSSISRKKHEAVYMAIEALADKGYEAGYREGWQKCAQYAVKMMLSGKQIQWKEAFEEGLNKHKKRDSIIEYIKSGKGLPPLENVDNLYTSTEVAQMFYDFTDDFPCNFNDMDECTINDKYCENRCGNKDTKEVDCWKHAIENGWI